MVAGKSTIPFYIKNVSLNNQNGNSDNRKQSPPQNNIPTDGNVNLFSKSNLRGPLLQVLPVYVTDKNGKRFKVNVLLDSRSDSTLTSKAIPEYQKTIKEYTEKGLATKIKDENNTNNVIVYLPHHGVVNINKPHKVRVVFDAEATYNSTSLNKSLLKGPGLLNNLVGILTRFRMGCYAVMADIEQMFHQVFVENKDRDVLCFL